MRTRSGTVRVAGARQDRSSQARYLTRNSHAAGPLGEFAHVMAGLGAKRGPMLLQMPPSFTHEQVGALRDLLPALPAACDAAARFAIEFRHRSLLTTDVFELLKEHRVAHVASDYTSMPRRFVPTTDFVFRTYGGPSVTGRK